MKANGWTMVDAQLTCRNPTSKGGLPLFDQMAQFSYAYIHAVASSVGCETIKYNSDYQSTDVLVRSGTLLKNVSVIDPKIDFQLKSTTQNLIRGNSISYPLSIKNYNDLRAETQTPRVLLLLILPDNPDEWVIHDHFTHLKTCSYFKLLREAPEITNATSITINIPTKNLFTVEVLHRWIKSVANGEKL